MGAPLFDVPPVALELGSLFENAGYEFALVGGSVRDMFLKRDSYDLDFTTNALPDETERVLKGWTKNIWDIGREFGTICGNKGGQTVEITTYRTDEYDPASRKPLVEYGDTLEGDLSRRDFTINCIALRLPSLKLVDPFNGVRDLGLKVLRTPIEPLRSFDDDPLRMMRGVRFVSQLGFSIENSTASAINELASRLNVVSAERVRDEFTKLLLSPGASRGVDLFCGLGLAYYVMPELLDLQMEPDEHHHHKDVYEHSLMVLDKAIAQETRIDPVSGVASQLFPDDEECVGPDLELRLAALLHDIAKPRTKKNLPGGQVSFLFHDVEGAKMCKAILGRLKFDKTTVKNVAELTRLHLRFHGYGESTWTDSAVRRYITDAGDLLPKLNRLTRADCTTRNERKAKQLEFAYDDLVARIKSLKAAEEFNKIRPDLNGHEIMDLLNLHTPDKRMFVGAAYAFLYDLRVSEGPSTKEATEARLREWWASIGQNLTPSELKEFKARR